MILNKGLFFTTIFCFAMLTASAQQAQTFTNPLLPAGADPWCIYKNGYYYYTNTTGNNITIWKTKSIATLRTAQKKLFLLHPKRVLIQKKYGLPKFTGCRANGTFILQPTVEIILITGYGCWKMVLPTQ